MCGRCCGRCVCFGRIKLRFVICIAIFLFIANILNQLSKIEDPALHKPDPWTRKWTRKPLCNAFQIRQKLCQEYLNHTIGGNLCHDLCITDNISLEPICESPKDTTFIIYGKWKDKDIVLKRKKGSHGGLQQKLDQELSYVFQDQADFLKDDEKYREAFINHIYDHIIMEVNYEDLRNVMTPTGMLDLMYHPYSKKSLSHPEMQSLWSLVHQEEFIKFQLLQNTKHIPRVYGFCGVYYAVERVQSLESLMNVLKRPPPWLTRVHIGLEMLQLVDELKISLIGNLSLCDVHPGNFGLAKDGRVVALDVDTAFTAPQMDVFMGQGNCTSNKDCTFFDCMSICNITSGACTSTVLTNNLYNVCSDLFVSIWGMPGILNIPLAYQHANSELQTYLNECAMEMKLPWQPEKEKRLHQQIYNFLLKTSQN